MRYQGPEINIEGLFLIGLDEVYGLIDHFLRGLMLGDIQFPVPGIAGIVHINPIRSERRCIFCAAQVPFPEMTGFISMLLHQLRQ